MAKSKKKNEVTLPKLDIAATNKMAMSALKSGGATQKEKDEVKRTFGGDRITPKDATALGKGPIATQKKTFSSQEELDNYVKTKAREDVQVTPGAGVNYLKRTGAQYNLRDKYDTAGYDKLTEMSRSAHGQEKRKINAARARNANPQQRAAMRKEMQAERDYYVKRYNEAEAELGKITGAGARVAFDGIKAREIEKIRTENKNDADFYEAILNELDLMDKEDGYNEASENADVIFGRKGIENGERREYVPTSLRDTQYDYINMYHSGEQVETDIKPEYTVMTPYERNILNSLPITDREAYLSAKSDILKKRYTEKKQAEAAEYAQEHPFAAGLKGTLQGVAMGIPAVVDNAVENITGDIDTYDFTGRAIRQADTYRSAGSQAIREKYGQAAGIAYDTGFTLLDVGLNMLAGKGAGALLGKVGMVASKAGKAASGIASANMSGRAAASAMTSIADRGGNDRQIITGGLASGLAEFIFEKYSLDKLLGTKSAVGVGNIIKSIAKQSAVEGSEELFTEAANIITDAIIMQGQSESELRRRELMLNYGLSEREAAAQSVHENVMRLATAGGMGALAGGIMGGGAVTAANASHTAYMKRAGERLTKNPDIMNRVLAIGIKNNNAEANHTAQMISDGMVIDSAEAGKMMESVLAESMEKDGGIVNIMRNITAIEGRGESYMGTDEAIDTAKAVMRMTQGKVTDAEREVLQRSRGAVTLLTAIEGHNKAWESVKKAAGEQLRVRSEETQMRGETAEIGRSKPLPYGNVENDGDASIHEAEVYSQGERVTIPENSRIIKNVVLDEESMKVRRRDAQAYKNVEILAQDLRMRVKYVSNLTDSTGTPLDGVITSQGIFINSDAENPSRFAATHEFSHRMKQAAPETWQRYQNFVTEKLQKDGRYENIFKGKAAAYNNSNADYINEEIAADYIGELFGNEAELAEFIKESRRDAVTIRDIWYGILDKLGLLNEKKKAQLMWRDAYKAAVLNVEKGNVGEFAGEVKFSIKNITGQNGDYGIGVYLDTDIFNGISPRRWGQVVEKFVAKNLAGKEIITYTENGTPEILQFAKKQDRVKKDGAKNSHPVLGEIARVKGNIQALAVIHIDEIAEVAKYSDPHNDNNNHQWLDQYGWDYKKAYIQDIKGNIWETTLNIANARDGRRILYGLSKTKRIDVGVVSSTQTGGTRTQTVDSNKSLTQKELYVKQNGENDAKKSVSGARISDIESENAELRKQLENLHIQLNQAEGKGLDIKEIKRVAQVFRKTYGSKMRLSELHQDLTKLYTLMSSGKATADEVSQRVSEIADKVINNATQTVTNEEYSDLLDRIKNVRIMVPELEKSDFRDGYETFRKRNMGKITLVNDGTDLDVFWDELTEEYPNLFDEDILGSEERLNRILEVRDEFAPREESVFASDAEKLQAHLKLKNDIIETFFKIPERGSNTKYVFYDERAAGVEKEFEKAKQDYEKLLKRTVKKFEGKLEKTEDMYENEINRIEGKHQAELDNMSKAVERAEEKVTKIRDKYDRDKVSKSIERVFGFLFNMTEKPTDSRHVPEKLKKDVKGFVDRFVYETKIVGKTDPKETKVLVSVRLDNIGTVYEKILRSAWESDLKDSPLLDERLSEAFGEFMEEIPEDSSGNFKRFEDMTTRELATISDMLTGIHHAITQSNKLFSENIKETKSEASNNVYREMDETRGKRKGNGEKWVYSGEGGRLYKAYNWMNRFVTADMLQPWDMFHQIGGTMENLYGEARKAFNKHIKNLQTARKIIKKAVGKLDVNKITGKDSISYTFELLGGGKIKLYKGQILSLYALYKRPQGRQHIESGGIVTERLMWDENGNKTGGAIHLAHQDIEKIFNKISNEEMQMVDAIVEFMSKTCAEWGNEASMKLLGFEKYGEGWYFPIEVWDGSRNKEGKKKGDRKLTGQTFTKELVKDAGNAIIVKDFFDTVLDHIVGMSLYNTVALPILDMERVLNHSTDKSSIRQARAAIEKTYGSNVVNYIYNWMTDVNGNIQTVQSDEVVDFFLRNATKTNIAFKLSVLLKQGTSIVRACQIINPKHIITALNGVIHPIKTTSEMQEHIPIAYYKSLGFRNPYTSRDIKTAILDMEPLSDKAAFGAYGIVDDFTWGVIYTAVKSEVEIDIKKNKLDIEIGSEKYWEKVVERFDYVIDRTQVVDTVFHRSQIMRSNNPLTKIQTLYMSEPIKSLNMYRTELQDGIRNKTKLKSFSRATAVFLTNAALLAAVGAFAKVPKDEEEDFYDDKGKRIGFWKRYLGHAIDSSFDEFNPMKMVPYLKTLVAFCEGWAQKDVIWENVEKAIMLMKNIHKGNGKTWYRNMYDVSTAVALVFGNPYGNALKEVEGIARTLVHQLGDEYCIDYLIAKSKWNVKNPDNKSKFMKYYDMAVKNGNADAAATILHDYMAETFEGQSFKNKHTEKVIGEMSKLYGKTDEDNKLLYELPRDKFSVDGEEYTISESDYPKYVSGAYKILWDMAYEMVTSEGYKKLSDEDKVRSFGEIKDYAQEAQRMEIMDDYELSGWQEDVYSGRIDYIDGALERVQDREYEESREGYKDDFAYNKSDFSEAELGVVEKVESDAATYYASVEKGREYNEKTLRHIKVYDEKLSDEMPIEEYAGIRAYAKKTAAMADGKESMKKNELKAYLDSTDYSVAVKRALFEAIGNSNWNNPY